MTQDIEEAILLLSFYNSLFYTEDYSHLFITPLKLALKNDLIVIVVNPKLSIDIRFFTSIFCILINISIAELIEVINFVSKSDTLVFSIFKLSSSTFVSFY